MSRCLLFASVAMAAFVTPALAQQTTQPGPAAPESAKPANDQGNTAPGTTDGSGNGQQDRAPAGSSADASAGDIIVTATRRNEALSDVPLAVSAVTAATLQNSGGADIRALNQVSPSLLVVSSSSEAGAGAIRIRGIGTVGENPGLESSVATFIDGVYRNRSGVGLSELGAIDRVEVLRGPQGTLFGRNASAGLVSVITAKPSFNFSGEAEATYGNYDQYRFSGGITGPITDTIAARLDGVYFKRDGFLKDVISGRQINNRDRYLVRGQLLFQPNDDLSFRLIGDYSDRREECCGATYLPAATVTANADGTINRTANSILAIERGLGAIINDNPFARQTSITPGVTYQGNVRDAGISGELNAKFGDATLTSITAYRDWRFIRGQDADFNNLDILRRDNDGNSRQTFKTFSQELRLQGTAFDDHLDFLVGGYYANEKLGLTDNLRYGADYERFSNCLLIAGVLPSALAPTPGGSCINVPVVRGTIAALSGLPAGDPRRASIAPLSALIANPLRPGFGSLAAALGQPGLTLTGGLLDRYQQESRNYAFFTHNVIRFTDAFNLTLGARYTNERKTLDATFTDVNNDFCRVISASPLAAFSQLPCVIPSVPGGSLTRNGRVKAEDQFTGTAVVSFKPTQGLLTYASYSRGYKAGEFNLDRSGLSRQAISPTVPAGVTAAADTTQLTFDPEIVNAYELGAKFNRPGFSLNIAAFYQTFKGYQLNAFTGLNFVVFNINACKTGLNGGDTDNIAATGACTGGLKPGVRSSGLELEAFARPARHFGVNLGFTYTDTKYRRDLVGTNGIPLDTTLFQLPGNRLTSSSQYVTTGSLTWTPPLGSSGLSGLAYVDFRYQSALNAGSDLDLEKVQPGIAIVNARVGLRAAESRFGIELWAQNVFNTNYIQGALDMPLQGAGTTVAVQRGFIPSSNQLYGAFLAEPRTYGITARVKF